jgi:hypothetical protein
VVAVRPYWPRHRNCAAQTCLGRLVPGAAPKMGRQLAQAIRLIAVTWLHGTGTTFTTSPGWGALT